MNSFKVAALASVACVGHQREGDSDTIITDLVNDGLIAPREPATVIGGVVRPRYKLTEKGRVMMNALVSVPEPIPAYTMPGKE